MKPKKAANIEKNEAGVSYVAKLRLLVVLASSNDPGWLNRGLHPEFRRAVHFSVLASTRAARRGR